MPLWSDMNGFPEPGFPLLANELEQTCMGTLYSIPLKANNLMLDIVGNNRLLGALVIGGGLSGVTTLAMGGALSGATTIGASGLVTLSGATPLTITNTNAVVTITGLNASLGTTLQRVNKGFFNNLEITNRPIVGQDYVALIGDLNSLVPYNNAQYDLNLGTKKVITSEIDFESATTRIFKDGSNNLSFTDAVTGTKTLAELASASSYVYNNSTPMPVDVGGYEDGTTFTNQTLDQMFDGLLYPYQYPAFSTFIIQSQTTPLEVGASIAANRVFTWTTNDAGDDRTNANITAGSIVIRDVTGNANIATGLDYDDTPYTSTYGSITKNTATTNVFSITGTNTRSQTFTRNYTVTWQWKVYYGESTTTPLVETNIEALRIGVLSAGFAKTYAFNALSGGYKYLCYPSVLGTATSFKDAATQLPVPMETVYTVSVTNTYGVTTNYNVHRSTNILNDAINIIVA